MLKQFIYNNFLSYYFILLTIYNTILVFKSINI